MRVGGIRGIRGIRGTDSGIRAPGGTSGNPSTVGVS